MKYEDSRLILVILQLVFRKGNIESIISENISYATVYQYIRHLKRNGLITDINNVLKITELGIEYIDILNKDLGRKHSAKWISPQYEYVIDKWDKYRVYLPYD